MSEKPVIREIFEPKLQKAGENCTMKTCMSYSSAQYFGVIILRNVKGAGNLAHVGEKRNLYIFIHDCCGKT